MHRIMQHDMVLYCRYESDVHSFQALGRLWLGCLPFRFCMSKVILLVLREVVQCLYISHFANKHS